MIHKLVVEVLVDQLFSQLSGPTNHDGLIRLLSTQKFKEYATESKELVVSSCIWNVFADHHGFVVNSVLAELG